jgi:hypothetical protein
MYVCVCVCVCVCEYETIVHTHTRPLTHPNYSHALMLPTLRSQPPLLLQSYAYIITPSCSSSLSLSLSLSHTHTHTHTQHTTRIISIRPLPQCRGAIIRRKPHNHPHIQQEPCQNDGVSTPSFRGGGGVGVCVCVCVRRREGGGGGGDGGITTASPSFFCQEAAFVHHGA